VNRRAQSRSSGLFLGSAAALIALLLLTQLPLAAGPRGYLKGAMTPVAVVTSGFLDWVGGGLSVVGEASHLRSDNQRLAAENALLRRQVAELQAAGQENADLRRALDFAKGFGHRLLTATVIGRAPDGLTRSISIGRGRADGVSVGMVVVSGAGLVGRVSEVTERSATVSESESFPKAVTLPLSRPPKKPRQPPHLNRVGPTSRRRRCRRFRRLRTKRPRAHRCR